VLETVASSYATALSPRPSKLDADLYERLAAEEAIYAFESDPMVNWDADERVMRVGGFSC